MVKSRLEMRKNTVYNIAIRALQQSKKQPRLSNLQNNQDFEKKGFLLPELSWSETC